jgi:hypothetical protein
VTERDKQPSKQNLQQHVLRAGLLGGLLNGCVIVLILGVALALGLWLDASTDTDRRVYTFIFVIASVPVTFVAIYLLGRWFSARMAPPKVESEPGQYDFLEDDDSGNN